jgi:hypothetical protein
VCDDDGKATDQTTLLDVTGPVVTAPPADAGASAACPQPAGGGTGGGSGGGGGGTGGGTGGGSTGGGTQDGGGAASTPAALAAPVASLATPTIGLFRLAGKPRSRRDGSVVLKVLVPSAGRFTVRAAGTRPAIRPTSARAGQAGTVSVTVRPSKAGLGLLRRKGRATVKTALVFTPVGGKPQRSSRVLTLQRTRNR